MQPSNESINTCSKKESEEKQMKRRVLSGLLTGIMSLSLLAGTSFTAAAEDVYDMNMEIITYGFDDVDLQEVEDAVNEISVPEIGVRVHFVTVAISEMMTKLPLLAASNEKMDLVQSGLLTTPSILASQGLIQPMTDYLSDAMKEKAGVMLHAGMIGDDIYAYPGTLYSSGCALFLYDKALAEEYNIEIPEILTTPEDYDKLFSQIVESGMPQYAVSMGDGVAAEMSYGNIFDTLGDSTYIANGCVLDVENGTTVENWYATDEYKQNCEMHRDWFEKGYALPDSISNGYAVFDSMMQGQVFGFFGRCSAGSNVAYWSAQTGKELGSIPVGTGEYLLDTASTMNTAWSISSSSENPQKTADFLELMYNNLEITNLMDLGIEGKHYVVNEGSHIVDYPEGVDAGSVGYGHTIGTYGDQAGAYFRAPLTDEFVDNLDLWGPENAKVSRFMGYNFDTSSVSSEITAVIAEIGKYGPALNVGTVDTEEMLPTFLDALEAAGMSKIIEENQRQLDEWLAAHAE